MIQKTNPQATLIKFVWRLLITLTVCLLLLSGFKPSIALTNAEPENQTLDFEEIGVRKEFFVAPNIKPVSNGKKKKPWDLQTALNHPGAIQPGAIIYLRGGTYKGKFISNLNGSATNPITIRSFPGEWAKIDGYVTTTLTAAISSTATTITVTDATNLATGQPLTFHDGVEGTEEICYLQSRNGNTLNILRGWNGTARVSHAAGATLVLGGNQITVNGSYTIFRDLEITNSDPTRQQTLANSQNGPHIRGEGFFNLGANNKFINCIIHNVQDGYFNGDAGIGPEVYGNIIFNNGYVAGGAYNGHGLYLIHSNAASTAFIKENIVFNNSNMGIKGDSQNGNAVNIWSEGNVAFNNGSWAADGTRKFNILMASNNGIADAINVKDNFFYHPNDNAGGSVRMGLGGASNGRLSFTGNYLGGGTSQLQIDLWSNLTFTGNTIAAGGAGASNEQVVLYMPSAGASVAWNNNTYFNATTNTRGYFYNVGSSSLTFPQWKTTSGFDASSTQTTGNPTTTDVFVRANSYDSNQATIIVYNWSGIPNIKINLSDILSDGEFYSIYSVEDIFGQAVVSGTYMGGRVSIPASETPVAQPVGRGNPTPSMRPTFAVFRVWKGSRPF